ncbi:hypothetical protein VIGAN_03156800, partial [Vigna angularis var. angularis]
VTQGGVRLRQLKRTGSLRQIGIVGDTTPSEPPPATASLPLSPSSFLLFAREQIDCLRTRSYSPSGPSATTPVITRASSCVLFFLLLSYL